MKKILSIILILISINSLGQDFPGVQSMSNATTRLIINGGLDAKKGMINGNYVDTTAANAGFIDFHHGAQIWTISDKNLWLRDSILNMWIRMAKFSEVGGTDTHMGNTNLTQTANRTYTGGSFNYTWNGLGTWQYNFGGSQLSFSEGSLSISGGTTGGTGNPFLNFNSDNADFAQTQIGINVPTYISRLDFTGDATVGGIASIKSNYGGATHFTELRVETDSIVLKPLLGQLNIDSLRTQFGDTTTWKPLVWSPHQKAVKKFNSWGEIGLGGGTNIYNSNGSLTGTRTLSLNTLTLNIQQNSNFRTSFNSGGYGQYFNDGTIVAEVAITPGNIQLSKYDTDELGLASSVQLIDSLILRGVHAGFGRESKIIVKDSAIRFWSTMGRYHFMDMPIGPGTHAVRIDANGKLTRADTSSGGSSGFDITSEDNFQHYLDKLSSVYGAFYWVSSGTGSAIQGFTNNTVPLGFLSAHELKTGTTTTGLACHYTQQSGTYAAIALSSSIRYNFRARVQIPVVSDGTETFEYYAGFMDDITGSANIVDGVYFTYTHSVSSGQWVCHTENNNTKTTTASGVTMTAGQNYDLKITVIGGTALFYIDDVLVVTTATNVPDDDTNRITTIGDCIIKSAGTTSRSVYVDVLAYGRRGN